MKKDYKKIKSKINLVFVLLFIWAFLPMAVKAGFGISPPYVRNDSLARGSHYEQKIVLVRGDPTEDWKAKISINIPEADDWISIDRGMEFIMPQGEKQVPIVVSVDVPRDADFGNYKGNIRIRTTPFKPQESGGGVSIALGIQIDVDINVVKKEIFDFLVKGINVFDLESGQNIKILMRIENIGNVKTAPTKVHLDIYDSSEENLLESVDNSNKLAKVKPFTTKEVTAEFPNQLEPGSYWAQIKIFLKDEIINEGKLHLSVLPGGSLQAPPKVLDKTTSRIWLAGVLILIILIFSIRRRLFKNKKKK